MKRRDDWRVRLGAYLSKSLTANDMTNCGLFAAGAIEVTTDVDILGDYRGKDRSVAATVERLKAAGFADVISFVRSVFPEEKEVHPSRARYGDLVAFKVDDAARWAFGICIGEHSYVLGPAGMSTVPTLTAETAFVI